MERVNQETLLNHAWAMVVRGIIAVAAGIILITWTDISLLLIIVFFAVYLLFDGSLAVYASIRAMFQHRNWQVFLFEGTCGLIIGSVMLIWPGVTALVLLYLVAVWAAVTGLIEIFTAFALPWRPLSRWLVGLAGVLSLALGVILIFFPIGGLVGLAWVIGLYAIAFGLTLFIMGIFLVQKRRALGKMKGNGKKK